MAPVNLNIKLLVRFLFALILIHPAITFSENKPLLGFVENMLSGPAE